MSNYSESWEKPLLEWAYQGTQSKPPQPAKTDMALLKRAYTHCTRLTAQHSRTFYLASALLPAAKSKAARALYAFCRISDDLVDHLGTRAQWEQWYSNSMQPETLAENTPNYLVLRAWHDTQSRYQIPHLYVEQLLNGIARDIDQKRYQTFSELATYCYGAASTVGLMVMYIIGYRGFEAIPSAVKLGVALQLTNILRDVGEDWRMGRCYLPQEELRAYDLSEEDLQNGQPDARWHALMHFQIARVRRLYTEASPGLALLQRDGRFAIAAAAELYRGILDDLEAHNMDNFRRRAYLSNWEKLRRLPKIWWQMEHRR